MPDIALLVEAARRDIVTGLYIASQRRFTPRELEVLERLLEKHIRLARSSVRIDPRPTPAAGSLFPVEEETTPRGRLPQGVRTQRK